MKKNKVFAAIAILFLGACSGRNNGDVAQSSKENLPVKKILNVGLTQEFEILNPVIAQMVASTYLSQTVNQPLVSIDANWKWQCYLCKELPSIENGTAEIIKEKGLEKILTHWEIRENAKWGDGTPVTGYDALLSWEVGNNPNISVPQKSLYSRMESIEVDPNNPKKFTIKYKEPQYDYYQIGTFYLLPSHIEKEVYEASKDEVGAYEKQTTYATNPTRPGLYQGAYRVEEIKLGSHVVVIKNDTFDGVKPAIEKIVFKYIPNTQTLEANLLSGTIDMISELGMTFDQAMAFEQRMKEDPSLAQKYSVKIREGMTYEHIDLNLRNEILKDLRVRKALVLAINRDELVQSLFQGKQKKALHFDHPLDVYYTEDVEDLNYNPEKASQLLEEAGWKMGSEGIRERNGQKLSFQIMTTTQNKTRELVEVYLQSEWKKVGIEISIKNEPARVYFGETIRKAKYPAMAMYAWSSSPDNPPKSTLHSEEIPTEKNGYSGQNSGGYKNKVVDTALDKIMRELDVEKRKEYMTKVIQAYVSDVPVIPLYLRSEVAVIPANMTGFEITGHQFLSSKDANLWSFSSEQPIAR